MCGDTLDEKKLVETPWMTVDEVALYLSVSPGTIRNWVSQHYVPFARRGRVVRFHRGRIDEWLGRGACKGRSQRAPSL
jgi:excisionase family DNA binding protein